MHYSGSVMPVQCTQYTQKQLFSIKDTTNLAYMYANLTGIVLWWVNIKK